MKRKGYILAWLIGCLAAACLPEFMSARGAEDPDRIAEIVFSADIDVDFRKLAALLPFSSGSNLDAAGIRQAIENLYRLNEFHYIECLRQPAAGGVRLEFRLVGKRYFGKLILKGPLDPRRMEEALMRFYPLGEAYSTAKEQQFLAAAEKLLNDYGFFPPMLKSRMEYQSAGRGADLVLLVDQSLPAILRGISWSGDRVLPQEKIQKASRLKPGQTFSQNRVREAIRQLRALYMREKYLTPQITLAFVRQDKPGRTVDVGIDIQAGPRVDVILEGASLSGRKLKELLPVYRESSLDRDLLSEGASNLQTELLAKGYTSAKISYEVQSGSDGATRLFYRAALEDKQPVDRIAFQGNSAVPRRDLLRWMGQENRGIREGRYFTRLGFEAGQERILAEYRRLGYQDASIQRAELTALENGHILVDLDLSEGKIARIGRIELQGEDRIPGGELPSKLALREGDPFSAEALEAERKSLQEHVLGRGYTLCRVEARYQRVEDKVDVQFQIDPGKAHSIGPVYFVGQEKTRLKALRRNIDLKTGQPVVVRQMFEGEQKLYNTGAFDQVHIRPVGNSDAEAGQPVVVGVREGRSRLLNFGFGFREYEGPRGLVEISHLNPGGLLRTAQIRLKGSVVNQSAVLSLRQPRPLNRNLESYAQIQASRSEETSFTETRYGTSFQTIRDLSRVNALIFRYNFERVSVTNMPPSEVESACQSSQTSGIQRESCPIEISSFSAAFYNDSRNDPFDPQRGAFASINLQMAAPLPKSDASFAKLFAQGQYYLPFRGKFMIAEAFRFGWAYRFGESGLLPISERFFAGGSSTLRGFGNDQAGPRDPVSGQSLGGNSMLINNLEFIFPLFYRFQGSIFYDTGNVFLKSIRLQEFSNSVGLGVRLKTPLGPLRLEYGQNLHPPPGLPGGHFFISFGPLF